MTGRTRRSPSENQLGLTSVAIGLFALTSLASTAYAKQSAPFGRLDREVIRGVILARMPDVQACYEAGLTTAPELAGRVVVSFTIAPDGHVAGATMHETSLAPRGAAADSVETCIVVVVLGLRFPPPEGGGPLQVNYPFVLAPAVDAGLDAGLDAGVDAGARRRRRGH